MLNHQKMMDTRTFWVLDKYKLINPCNHFVPTLLLDHELKKPKIK
jgi:hypothetical protein